MADFLMPSLGADMEFGTLVQWRVKAGDAVRKGTVVAEVETQKGVIEVEIFEAGVVEELLVQEGTKVPVGAPLARIADGARAAAPAERPRVAQVAPPPSPAPPAVVTPSPVMPAPAAPPVPAVPPPPARQRISPLARRMAADLGIALEAVTGTGEHGAITKADIERAAAARSIGVPPPPTIPTAPPAVPPPAPAVRQEEAGRTAAMRQAIAAAVSRSNREIPHYYLATDVDMTRALAWMRETNEARPLAQRLLSATLVLAAIARALREIPELNGFYENGALRASERVNLGIAIALRGGGLVAPAIHDAEALPIDQLDARLKDLVARARSGGLRSSEITDATVTVTNLGELGVQTVFGVIYPPQVALVGVGRIAERAWAAGGLVGSREVATITLAADHRASDGHRGGLFLNAVERFLQEPERL
jgi:pyruvate dehydrogenase E2 component (dihydrolipoamide acetyltransferase)